MMETNPVSATCDDTHMETDGGDQPSKGSSTTWEYPLTDDNDNRSDHNNEDNNNLQQQQAEAPAEPTRSAGGGRPKREGDSLRLNIVINSNDQSLAEKFIDDRNKRLGGQEREDARKQSLVATAAAKTTAKKKKRKRKVGKTKVVEPPPVDNGEVLVPVHSVWHRNRRVGAGHVIKKGDQVLRYVDRKGIVYSPKGKRLLEEIFFFVSLIFICLHSIDRFYSSAIESRFLFPVGCFFHHPSHTLKHAVMHVSVSSVVYLSRSVRVK